MSNSKKPVTIVQRSGMHNPGAAGFCRECSGCDKPCGNTPGKSSFGKPFSSSLFSNKLKK